MFSCSAWPIGLVFGLLSLAACEREPLEQVCAPLQAGDLVISELRGKQTGTDTWGQWIELYNDSGEEASLSGVSLLIRKLDGSDMRQILIRSRTLTVAAQGYFVLGRFPDDLQDADDLPDHVDYGFENDFATDLYEDAVLEAYSCEELLDGIVYRDLPDRGSLAFDGDLQPTAAANDNEEDWCVDDADVQPGDGGTAGLGIPGTPGQANRPCE